jgi:hypothetical protein
MSAWPILLSNWLKFKKIFQASPQKPHVWLNFTGQESSFNEHQKSVFYFVDWKSEMAATEGLSLNKEPYGKTIF